MQYKLDRHLAHLYLIDAQLQNQIRKVDDIFWYSRQKFFFKVAIGSSVISLKASYIAYTREPGCVHHVFTTIIVIAQTVFPMFRQYTLNMDISFGNGNSILKLLRGVSHSKIEFGVGIQSK